MADHKLGLAALAAALLLALVPYGSAQAAMLSLELSPLWPSEIVQIAQDGPRFHHGKRVQTAYCLRRNYWWFYRPYTTAQEDFPRCEPYFHYLEPGEGRRGARAEPYFK